MSDVRYSGQIASYWPATAPLELRLPQAVYDESSPMGPTSTGPGLSMPMGDLDSDFGDVVSTLSPGKPLRSARGPIGRVRPAPAVPSWVRTDRMLALQGCTGCDSAAPSMAVSVVVGALIGLLIPGVKKQKGALIGAAGGAAYSFLKTQQAKAAAPPESPVTAQGGYVVI